MTKLNEKIDLLQKQKEVLTCDLIKEKFPNGGLVYAIDYTNEIDGENYRIGMTDNMNNRKSIYDTHTLHKRKVIHYIETKCPCQFEKCLQSLLYKYRYKKNKDYYICSSEIIIKAFNNCVSSIECMKQSGGSLEKNIETIANKINLLNDKLNLLNDELNNKPKILIYEVKYLS